MVPAKWVERNFNFGNPPELLPNLLTRLSGTEARMRELIKSLSEDQLKFKKDGRWGIKEQLGHLCDLEDLHEGRIDDFLERKELLRPADMKNVKTEEAGHNAREVSAIIDEFATKRQKFISRLESLDRSTLEYGSFHERMGKKMNPVDLAYFTAEHDDHHLTYVRDISLHFRK